MLRQYLRIKERHRDAILFFRLGDFYEMFFEDAEKASKILDSNSKKDIEGTQPLHLCVCVCLSWGRCLQGASTST